MDYKEKLKAIINSNKTPFVDIDTFLKYFPELESEDEKIRKELLQIAKESEDSFYMVMTPNKREKLIAWLEKQEQKPAWTEEDKNMLKWVIGYLENKMLNTPISEERTACKNAIAWLEEKLKGEPNPCDGCINRKGCINCENGELRETEQKPTAWSEEDETTKNNISHIIRQYDKISKRENKPCWYIGDCLLWMQNIKDRIQPQQAWSGGDEAHLHSLITHLEQWIESNPDTTGADIQGENVAWLKSLRPKSQWKPSIAQLNALSIVSKGNAPDDIEAIVSLYQDLKKLREE